MCLVTRDVQYNRIIRNVKLTLDNELVKNRKEN